MRRGYARLLAGVGVCVALACELGEDESGGGPGLGPEQTVTLSSTDTLDGWVRDDGNGSSSGTQLIVGDLVVSGADRGYRGFYSFDLSAIPAGATITSATLRAYQFNLTGNPYGELGSVIVDHVDYGATLGTLEDYGGGTLAANIGTLSTNATFEYKALAVTARVQGDLTAGRPRAQFRLRFSNGDDSNDNSPDFVQFCDAECFVPANVPQLVVKYREPVP
ncbi:MAG TPA: DNRLRE domain-containing protein [Gemmatimonadales bacterium]|nr:DNRLRE domain-containing protein [Gemmatimonadales bacterium]